MRRLLDRKAAIKAMASKESVRANVLGLFGFVGVIILIIIIKAVIHIVKRVSMALMRSDVEDRERVRGQGCWVKRVRIIKPAINIILVVRAGHHKGGDFRGVEDTSIC